jgi:hypothetical protein
MIRRFAVAAVAAAAIVTIVPSAPAQAYSQCAANTECGWLYYRDAARTQLQGGHTTNCDGVILDWGIKAGYSTFISQGCGGGPVS